jgi:hypothetical protein
MNFLRPFFVSLFCFLCLFVSAQIPTDLRNIKASQISDGQLQQYISEANARGIDANQLEAELLRRGLPASEMAELKTRIQQLQTPDIKSEPSSKTEQNNKRTAPKRYHLYMNLLKI